MKAIANNVTWKSICSMIWFVIFYYYHLVTNPMISTTDSTIKPSLNHVGNMNHNLFDLSRYGAIWICDCVFSDIDVCIALVYYHK